MSRACQLGVDLGWHPQAELRPEERGYYQALWALADEARDAETYVVWPAAWVALSAVTLRVTIGRWVVLELLESSR